MKYKLIYLTALLTLALSSCKDMDSIYKEYVIPDGIPYPEKVSALKYLSGLNRASLSWNRSTDPRVIKATIFWNNYADSVSMNINHDSDRMTYVFNHLEEGTYTFDVITYDKDGNASIPVEITGDVYGPNYVASLSGRSPSNPCIDNGSDGAITWGAKPDNLIFSEIRYKKSNGETAQIKVLPDVSSTLCMDVMRRELFEYRSAFLPPASIDTIYTEWSQYRYPFFVRYPKAGWQADATSWLAGWGDGRGQGDEGGYPRQIIDGDITSAWHSDPGRPLPHMVLIDMLEAKEVHHINMYLHPVYQYAVTVEVMASDAPEQASWKPVTVYTYPTGAEAMIEFPEIISMRYLIIRFPDSKVGQYANLAEVDIFGL